MSAPRTGSAVFTIPAGLPFLPILAEALLDGRLVTLDRSDPIALADVTVYLPTRRAVRSFRDVLFERLGGEAAILPRVRPIGDVDEDEHLLAPSAGPIDDLAILPESVPALGRRLALTRLTLAWARAVRRDALGLADDETLAIPASAADAARLAADLARLIDDVETEGVSWPAIGALAQSDHARYFQITLDFLQIVSTRWPAYLAEIGRSDPAARRDRLIRAEAKRLIDGVARGPVVAAGSTGTIPATAELLLAIAHSPSGAVVLPGLDRTLDAVGWAAIDDLTQTTAVHGHPQFGLKKLIAAIGISRDEIVELAQPTGDAEERAVLMSEVMRPSETSDAWGAGFPPLSAAMALTGFDLVIGRNEQEEAAAIAVAMREVVEEPGRTAALVTPERALARRVAAELARWNLDVDDSAGVSLDREPVGVFCRLLAACLVPAPGPAALVALLKSPLAVFGMPPRDARRAAQALEMALFHGDRFAGGMNFLEPALDRARASLKDRAAGTRPVPVARRCLADRDWQLAGQLAKRLEACFAPLARLSDGHGGAPPVAETTRALTEALRMAAGEPGGQDGHLWRGAGGEALARLLSGLSEEVEAGELAVPLEQYEAFLGALMADVAVPREPGGDPRLHIWGTLEARLQSVDLLILGGLDEGVWPAATRTDPWLSRAMRSELGLAPPERRLGLAAHDFVQGIATPRVICTRAEKRAGAPTVEARWLQRLRAVVGQNGLRQPSQRGNRLIALARLIDQPARTAPVSQPAPKPPVRFRPRKLRVTEIETLIRDPYAVYAKRVLGLEPFEPIGARPDRALRGIMFHHALGTFTDAWDGPFDAAAEARLIAIAEAILADISDISETHAIWSARFAAIAHWFVGWEAGRDGTVGERGAEIDGDLEIAAPAGAVTLVGRADRIDVMGDGTLAIYDHKTGSPPSERQVFAGLTPQMTLEVAMARSGAFGEALAGRSVSELAWLALGKVGRGEPYTNAVPRDQTADAMGQRALTLLSELVASYDDPGRGYLSRARPMLERARFRGDYDHLARVQEWSLLESDDDFR